MISRTVAIGSSVGLHARPASVLAEAVDESGVEVTIAFDGEEADAASLLEIMTLGAKHGDVGQRGFAGTHARFLSFPRYFSSVIGEAEGSLASRR